MKISPMLFQDIMVCALFDGHKRMTRRLIKLEPVHVVQIIGANNKPNGKFGLCLSHGRVIDKTVKCPYGAPGDLIWVRETWSLPSMFDNLKPSSPELGPRAADVVRYHADGARASGKTRVSIHMPRWASRLTLKITDVRVEQLQQITARDACAEGLTIEKHRWADCEYPLADVAYRISAASQYRWSDPLQCFQELWKNIHGADSWDLNPWLWVISFEVIRKNIDRVIKEAA